jgi:hypothetical protein
MTDADTGGDNTELRLCFRDLVKLSILSGSWINYAPWQIVDAVAGTLLSMLGCDLVFVILSPTSDEREIQVIRKRGASTPILRGSSGRASPSGCQDVCRAKPRRRLRSTKALFGYSRCRSEFRQAGLWSQDRCCRIFRRRRRGCCCAAPRAGEPLASSDAAPNRTSGVSPPCSAAAASPAGVRSSSTRLRDQSSGPMSCRSCRTEPARDRLIEIVNGSASGSVSLTALAFVAMQ